MAGLRVSSTPHPHLPPAVIYEHAIQEPSRGTGHLTHIKMPYLCFSLRLNAYVVTLGPPSSLRAGTRGPSIGWGWGGGAESLCTSLINFLKEVL